MLNLQQLNTLGLDVNIDIFAGIHVPSECEKLDENTLKSACFERCGLNIPIYPDPETFAAAVRLWSLKNQYTFIHVDNIMKSEYSPIENVFEDTDMTRKFDGSTDTDTSGSHSNESHTTEKLTDDKTTLQHGKKTELEHGKKVTESGSDDNNTTNTVSAYDSANYQPDNKSENKITYGHVATDSGKDTSTNSGTDTTTRNYTKKTDVSAGGTNSGKETQTKDDTEHVTTSRHGNIGITSANKLQIEEYNMLAAFNPYNFLAEMFEKDLTLYIY